MLGFLKKRKPEAAGPDFGDLDMPPAPPPIFEKHDEPMPFAPPPVERAELDSLPQQPASTDAMEIPMPEADSQPEKPLLPDFMEDKPLDIHIPEPERAASPPQAPLPPPPPLVPVMRSFSPRPAPPPVERPPVPRPVIKAMVPQPPKSGSIFAPSPTVHQGQSLFINVEEYKTVVDSISSMRSSAKDGEDTLFKACELATKEEAELLRFRRIAEDIERKFMVVDSKLFG
ncbi:MAG: hypothetical protein V1735_05880 [Nanoarchaeota archaeon]